MSDAFATQEAAVPKTLRREYTVRITRPIRDTLDGLAERYNIYTPDGTPRDAEIVRVLLVCALTEGMSPREQAAISLYVNGLMLVSQGLWLGLYDVRDDLAETMRGAVGAREGLNAKEGRPGNPARNPDRGRFHVKVEEWIQARLTVVATESGFVDDDGTVQDALLVAKLIEHAVEQPAIYEKAFILYARGIAKVRGGLIEGLTSVRDALREAVTTAAGG
jgi:hypothetical protein